VPLSALTADEFKQVDPSLDESLKTALGVENAIARFVSYGSTAPQEVQKQIQAWQHRLKI
jgi:argininosuccinate lyase